MKIFKAIFSRTFQSEHGAAMPEYVLGACLIALVALPAGAATGNSINEKMGGLNDAIGGISGSTMSLPDGSDPSPYPEGEPAI